MKNLTLSILIIFALSSCNSGSGSSGVGSDISNPTSPTMPDVVNSIPLNQLLKSDLCFSENGNQSSRRYITKISATELQLESDLFSQPNCELAPAPVVLVRSVLSSVLVIGFILPNTEMRSFF